MNILFICTHNRCRSILSEAITNHLSDGSIKAFSAGSQPVGQVHPLSIKYLCEQGIATEGLKSQSWDEFEHQNIELVVTVCDSAANEPCPVWFGDCISVHWGLPDPSKLEGSEDEIKQAFYAVMATIENRVRALLSLTASNLSTDELKTQLTRIAEEA